MFLFWWAGWSGAVACLRALVPWVEEGAAEGREAAVAMEEAGARRGQHPLRAGRLGRLHKGLARRCRPTECCEWQLP